LNKFNRECKFPEKMANILGFGLLISILGMGWAIDYAYHAEILLNIDKQPRNQGALAC
jgi:hypothetical protein